MVCLHAVIPDQCNHFIITRPGSGYFSQIFFIIFFYKTQFIPYVAILTVGDVNRLISISKDSISADVFIIKHLDCAPYSKLLIGQFRCRPALRCERSVPGFSIIITIYKIPAFRDMVPINNIHMEKKYDDSAITGYSAMDIPVIVPVAVINGLHLSPRITVRIVCDFCYIAICPYMMSLRSRISSEDQHQLAITFLNQKPFGIMVIRVEGRFYIRYSKCSA